MINPDSLDYNNRACLVIIDIYCDGFKNTSASTSERFSAM